MNRKLSFAVPAGFASLAMLAVACSSKPAATAQPAVTNVPPPSAPAAYPVSPTPAVQTVETPAPQPIDTAAPMLAADTSGVGSGTASLGGSKYTVKAGDTLFHIALTHYGSGGQWKKIVAANPGLAPNKLRVGQTITLP